MTTQSEFYTVQDIASYLRLLLSTVYTLAQDRVIPGFKIDKHWRFRRETFEEWLRQQEMQIQLEGENIRVGL